VGFFSKEEVPPAPDMSGVVTAAKDMTTFAKDLATQTSDWAKNAIADNKADIGKYTDQLVSDSDTARGMIDDFQNVANKQLGLADGAATIKEAAMTQATKQGAVQDTQLGIQQKQLGVEDAQLKNQQDQLGLQQDFRDDQKALQAKADQLFDQYSQTYAPAQARFMADAEAYGTPEKLAQARAGAQANVGDQFQAARDAATRQLESFGVKPSDTRFAALDLGTRIKEAATKAAAGDAAALTAEDRAFALRQAAIAQGKDLPNQSSTASGVANQAGANVIGQGNVANAAGSVANAAGANANAAGANAIGAGNAGTAALGAATGANNSAIAANSGAVQANTGALAANTAGATETGAAGTLTNQGMQTETGAAASAAPYVNSAVGGVNAQTGVYGQDYKNKMDNFKAEQSNTSGLGALLGTVAGPLLKAGLGAATGGASLPFTSGMGDTEFEANIIGAAEGGAIPMSASPSQGQNTDDVKAMLNAGEFIMPKDVTSWYGEKFFQDLIAKAQAAKAKAGAKPAIGPGMPGPPAVVSGPSAAQGAI
jgi:hypothetical protein